MELITFGMLVFRAQWGRQIFDMIYAIVFNFSWYESAHGVIRQIITYTWVLVLVQVFQFIKKDLLLVYKSSVPARIGFYYVCLLLLTIGGAPHGKEFIYFQF